MSPAGLVCLQLRAQCMISTTGWQAGGRRAGMWTVEHGNRQDARQCSFALRARLGQNVECCMVQGRCSVLICCPYAEAVQERRVSASGLMQFLAHYWVLQAVRQADAELDEWTGLVQQYEHTVSLSCGLGQGHTGLRRRRTVARAPSRR